MSVINRIIGVFRQLKWFYYICCYITLSFLIYSTGRYLFRELCQPWHSVHHSLPLVRKCSNVTDLYELPDFWLPNCPVKIYFIIKYGAASVPEKAQDVNPFEAASDVWVRVKQSVIDDGIMALIIVVDVSMPAFEPEEDIFNIHRDTN